MFSRTICMALIPVLITLFSMPINAEQSAQIRATARFIYDKTAEVPDDVFFSNFLSLLKVAYRGNLDGLASKANHELGFDDIEEAQRFSAYLIDAATSIRADSTAYKQSVVCPTDSPRPSGQAVYDALDSVDDEKDEISTRYLATLESELGDERFQRFLSWMNRSKASTTIIRFDHAKKNEGRDPDVVRQKICERLDALPANQGRQ